MGSISVDNHNQKSPLGNISDAISLETEHIRITFIDKPNGDNDDDIPLEDSPFVPKLNDKLSIEDATNRCFQRGQMFKDKNVLYENLKSFGFA